MASKQSMEQIPMTKKILDVNTKTWSDGEIKKIIPHLKKYKYKIDFKMPDGKVRYAYTNDEPELLEMYVRQINAVILKVTEL